MTHTEWLIERQLYLAQLAAGEAQDTDAYVAELEQELKDAIAQRQFKRNVNDAILTVSALWALNGLGSRQRSRFAAIAENEALVTKTQLGLTKQGDTLDNLFIQGAPYSDWLKKNQQDTRFAISRELRIGVAAGDTGDALFNRLKPILDKARRDIQALTITAVAAATNQARQRVYEANAESGDVVQHISVLDGKTSLICVSRSGLKWRLNDYAPIGHKQEFRTPPLHIRCRSVVRLLSKGKDEPLPTFTEFMDKRGPAFAEQVLGKGRYDLFQREKITLSQLLDPKTLKPLTLDQLKKL